jgi:putative oxidoreductase
MQRIRAVDSFVLWTLSVLLAALFLLVGMPKVLGTASVGFQAAAMEGFPPWLRIVIGLAEVTCAVGLLVPALATVAAACLALLMIPAAATQFASGQSGIWVPFVVFALLAYVAWRRNTKWVAEGYSEFAGTPHPLLREGIVAGLIGALTIAVWFGLLDVIAGHPFFTPATLGHSLLSVFGAIPPDEGTLTFVIVYSIFHFTAFVFVGLVASLIVTLARHEPSILLGFAILFAVTEIGIYGLVALLGETSPLQRGAWLPIMVGNVLAACTMGYYFHKKHSELEHELRHAFDYQPGEGEEDESDEAPGTIEPASPSGGRP